MYLNTALKRGYKRCSNRGGLGVTSRNMLYDGQLGHCPRCRGGVYIKPKMQKRKITSYTDNQILNAILDYKNTLISIGKLKDICGVDLYQIRSFIKQIDLLQTGKILVKKNKIEEKCKLNGKN